VAYAFKDALLLKRQINSVQGFHYIPLKPSKQKLRNNVSFFGNQLYRPQNIISVGSGKTFHSHKQPGERQQPQNPKDKPKTCGYA